MARELPPELIKHLIELASSERYDDCAALPERFPSAQSGAFMRLAPQPWYQVADALSYSEIAALIKALTVVEQRVTSCKAGSVSPVIWLFKRLSQRSGDDLSELADWVLAHTDNDYLPFGTYNYDAKSMTELRDRQEASHRRADVRRSEEEKRRLDTKERKAAEATRKLFGALRRRDGKAMAALVQQGADIHATNEDGQSAAEIARSLGLSDFLGTNSDAS